MATRKCSQVVFYEFFFKNYLGWRGQKLSLKISSGAHSENLEPSLTIQEFVFKKKFLVLYAAYVYPFWVVVSL